MMEHAWYLQMIGSILHLVIGEKDLGRVVEMKMCKTANMIKMMLPSKVVKRLEMGMFKAEANDLCLSAPQTRTAFVQYWETHGASSSTSSSEFDDSFGSSIGSDSSVGSSPAREASVSESSTPSQIPPANSHEEQMLMEYAIGTVEVHLENLIAPHPTRATRLLDYEHVQMLTDSFMDNSCGQVVLFQGMLTDPVDSISTLCHEGTGKVEVLGGNHSREALQTLLRKGTLAYSTVKCNLFKPLPRVLALRIGYAHNAVLSDKVKPVSFFDKTRLMRECRLSTSMIKEEMIKWKDTLVTVLGVKDRRRLVQSFGVHITIANLQPELWAKFSLAAEKILMSEKLMRGFVRLEDGEEQLKCLDILLAEGTAAFKQKVKTLIDAGHIRSRKNEKKRKADEPETEEPEEIVTVTDGSNDGSEEVLLSEAKSSWRIKYEELMEKYKQLETENCGLKCQIEKLQEKNDSEETVIETKKDGLAVNTESESKRRRCSTNVFKKGEEVMAFWRDDITGEETWQEATVIFAHADGRCRVQWKSDGMISTPTFHQIQKKKGCQRT